MKNKYVFAVITIEYTAWRFNDLPVPGSFQLGRATSAFGMLGKLVNVFENTPDQIRRGFYVV